MAAKALGLDTAAGPLFTINATVPGPALALHEVT